MPTYGPRLRRLLKDETPINAYGIADLLGVTVAAVKKWYGESDAWMSGQGWSRKVRLPEPDPALAARIGNQPRLSPHWPTKVIAEWAVDLDHVYLNYEGWPVAGRTARGAFAEGVYK